MNKKQLYWAIGIGAGLTGLGFLIYYQRKPIKQAIQNVDKTLKPLEQKAHNWLKPVVAKVTSGFGYRTDPKTGKKNAFHNGIDLAVPVGTSIKSPLPATVVSVSTNGPGGNQIILKHPNGYRTGYAHLSKILVKQGDTIQQNQEIGLSGNTGKSTGPHLHLTLTDPSGAKVDPLKTIYI